MNGDEDYTSYKPAHMTADVFESTQEHLSTLLPTFECVICQHYTESSVLWVDCQHHHCYTSLGTIVGQPSETIEALDAGMKAANISTPMGSASVFFYSQTIPLIPWAIAFNKGIPWRTYFKFTNQSNGSLTNPEWWSWATTMNTFYDTMMQEGPNDEPWGEPWVYCGEYNCSCCTSHATHFGVVDAGVNPDGDIKPLGLQASDLVNKTTVGEEPKKNLYIIESEVLSSLWDDAADASKYWHWASTDVTMDKHFNSEMTQSVDHAMIHSSKNNTQDHYEGTVSEDVVLTTTTTNDPYKDDTDTINMLGLTEKTTKLKEMLTKMNEETNTLNEQEKKYTAKYPVGSIKRAKKILKTLNRFDDSWNRTIGVYTFVNTLRCSHELLNDFVKLLLNNLLKKEAESIFRSQIGHIHDCATYPLKMPDGDHEGMIPLLVKYYDCDSKDLEQREAISNTISHNIAQLLQQCIDDNLSSMAKLGPPHYFTPENISDIAESRQQVKDCLVRSTTGGLSGNIFMKAFVKYEDNTGSTNPISQKAKSTRAIATSQESTLFLCPRSLYIPLQAAMESTPRELLLSVSRTWGGTRKVLSKSGLYIRTCPATPRPGALPNVLAKNPETFLNGVKMLAECMLDPTHSDYDPDGCLIIQRYIKPVCSGVIGENATSFIIGPNNDGVTAGGGSNIIFNLNTTGQRALSRNVRKLGLNDGMENHEIEFVYKNPASRSTLTWFKHLADTRHCGDIARLVPSITQLRGLHAEKMDILPPPSVNGVVLHIAGNVPAGVVEQLVVMDVGKGSLDECLELEQMVSRDELPEGLVVYAPGGTQNAHVAGLSSEHGFPAIYGVKPYKNHTVWTEIGGWVTNMPGAEPEPYDPTPFIDFYKIGVRDGDRFWTYNLAPLSQFFHNFISGPKNDPRLEAYLAGVFTSWIIKAALAVSMAELRHGLSSRSRMTPQRSFAHMSIQEAISGESGVSNLWVRSDYYHRLEYNEIGYEALSKISSFYADSYSDAWCEWSGGSYGGAKYFAATQPTVLATKHIKDMLNGKNVKLQNVLNQVNKLENAVHNTGFFFNKFLGDKNAFDIGTAGHQDFKSACEHWIVTAPFYAMFYTKYVNEPHRVAKGHGKLITHLTSQITKRGETQMNLVDFDLTELLTISRTTDETLFTTWSKFDTPLEQRELFEAPAQQGQRLHTVGTCGIEGCELEDCFAHYMLEKLGLEKSEIESLTLVFKQYREDWGIDTTYEQVGTLEHVQLSIIKNSVRDLDQTMFEKKERDVEKATLKVEQDEEFKAVYVLTDNDNNQYMWADKLLKEWGDEINDLVQEMTISEAVWAWKHPEEIFPYILEECEQLDLKYKEMDLVVFSKFYDTTQKVSGFTELVRKMIGMHHVAKQMTTNELLHKIHEESDVHKYLQEEK